MKILMIAPEPFFQPRGTPISVYQRLLALSSLGFQVDLLTYHIGEDVDIPGVVIHRIIRIPFIKNTKPGPSLGKLVLDPILFIYSVFMVLRHRYDVIHSHEEASFFAVPLAKLFGIKHLYDMHSSLPKQLESFRFWDNPIFIGIFKLLEEKVLRSSDAIITIGKDLDDLVKKSCPKIKTIKIENLPVQTIITNPGEHNVENIRRNLGLNGDHTVVYTGTFESYQGLSMFIESAQIIVNEYPKISFVLVGGNKGQIEQYQQLASEKQVFDYFRFTGNVPPIEAITYLELASVLVSPRLEGTSIPLKVYSYLLSGKPMVATDIPAHRLALNEDLAVLTAPNATAFAQGILKLIYDPELGLRLADRAKKFGWDEYGFDAYQRKVKLIYEMLVTG
jgi:glycosyltransferase involved in cell wall biosynthesis